MYVENQISQDGKEEYKNLLFLCLLRFNRARTLGTEMAESPPKLTARTLCLGRGGGDALKIYTTRTLKELGVETKFLWRGERDFQQWKFFNRNNN
jgi:hypothetical protein